MQEKVYLNILKEIEQIIYQDQLLPGDRLPSERELAERLNVGRSSVREALRSLELLDLIITRKGEGTFIQKSGGRKIAEVLARFFLREERARRDVVETRKIIEIEAVRLACERVKQSQLDKIEAIIKQSLSTWTKGEPPLDEDYLFHEALVESSQNELLLNVWRPLVEYSRVALKSTASIKNSNDNMINEHQTIFEALKRKDEEEVIFQLKNHLENSRF
ncbi:FadR/GntR family transcriptional regulator [Evansella sp. AB-P1]|uniref:FadR/GntR family transcriptional regulator n=1 Tax=Evansella sp. AB-P1 TaxID=3037653 RepID=UPI00241EF603|nr:FadR/GntR family transcriptional regulator [Evansella sp. AB-P1]MDG5786984.1 FadR/GntR family transcriptional regulator [Evansella sp. AB-P1]